MEMRRVVFVSSFFGMMNCSSFAQHVSPPPVGETFFIKTIIVEGNTLLNNKEIELVISHYEGKSLDLQMLKEAAQKLTELYQKHGYVLARVFVPPQKIENGMAKLLAVEGLIGDIMIEGNRAYSTPFIRKFIRAALDRGVLQADKLERALFLLNEFPDLRVQAFLKPGLKEGTADILVRAQDKTPLHEQIDYNNFGSRLVGRSRGGLELWHGNVSGQGDLFDVRGVFPFPSDEHVFLQGMYSTPVGTNGDKITASYANADIRVGDELQVLDIRGSARIYGLTLSQPLTRSVTEGSNLSESFYYKNVNNFLFGSTLTSRDKLRELVFAYDGHRSTPNARDMYGASLTQGLGTWFGGMASNDILASQVGAGNYFTKINGNYSHLQKVTLNDYLFFRSSAQYAFSVLTTTEQFSLGGPDSVRGYPQSEVFGDSGWDMSLEYRIPLTEDPISPPQGVIFVDSGFATLRNPQVGQPPKRHLMGAGFGLRMSFHESTSLRLDLGWPIDPETNSTGENPILYGQFLTQF